MPKTAPTGAIWVCRACGRTSHDLYEFSDVSCAMNAVLCHDVGLVRDESGRVTAALAFEEH